MLSSCRPRLHGPAWLLFGPGCWPRARGVTRPSRAIRRKCGARAWLSHIPALQERAHVQRVSTAIARKLAGRGIDAIHVSFQNECSHGHHFGVRRARSSARLARRSYSSAIRSILCLVSASLISSASTRIPSARSRHVVGSVNKDAGRGITALSDWEFPRLSRDSQTCHWCPVRRRP
jgi:hypothetical protein